MRVDPAALASAREAIRRNGFAVLRGALDPGWIADHREALRAYVEPRLGALAPESRAVGASASAPTFSIADAPPAVASFVTDPALAALAAALLGAPAVRLLHFCGFFKPPSGAPTPWHRDLDFIPLATDQVVSAWLPLVPVDAEMGLLAFAAGSHRSEAAAEPDFQPMETGPLLPGDVSFHLGRTLHGAGANRTERMRETIAVSYFADGARIGEDRGVPFRAALREHYFSGARPGDVAASPANPIVHQEQTA
jgi:ectoine hydroxylase-related dioxygenase (phytanoyl-CoA dioxygenase family)